MSLRIRLLLAAAQLAASLATIPALAQEAPARGAKFVERFDAANTTRDGRLTLAQAQAAHMGMVVNNFSAIDAQSKGFVTLEDVRAFRTQQAAARAAGAAGTPAR